MGRQTTDHTIRFWRRIPWDRERFPDQYHATWRWIGWALCNVTPDYRLSATDYIEVGPGVDFTHVDPRVCARCKRLADRDWEFIRMEPSRHG